MPGRRNDPPEREAESSSGAIDRQLEEVHRASIDELQVGDPHPRRVDRRRDEPGLDFVQGPSLDCVLARSFLVDNSPDHITRHQEARQFSRVLRASMSDPARGRQSRPLAHVVLNA